jgi:tetratricopeptide (TPR) repeat protein
MYYYRPERKRRSSPVRILILLVLIGGVLYVVTQRPELVTGPFVPTPTSTRSPVSYLDEAEALYWEGKLDDAIHLYEKAAEVDPENANIYVRWARLLDMQKLLKSVRQPFNWIQSTLKPTPTWQRYMLTWSVGIAPWRLQSWP